MIAGDLGREDHLESCSSDWQIALVLHVPHVTEGEMGNPWDLSVVVKKALQFRNERDWGQFHRPKELAAGLSIEVGELQELFLWREGETARPFGQMRGG